MRKTYKMKDKKKILGLGLGTNTIDWALVEENKDLRIKRGHHKCDAQFKNFFYGL